MGMTFNVAVIVQLTLLVFTNAQTTGQSLNEACTTPDRFPGTCIPIRQCGPLLNILMSQPLRPEAVDFLKQSQCGFQGSNPLVCCISYNGQVTPRPNDNTNNNNNNNQNPTENRNPSTDDNGNSYEDNQIDLSKNPLLPTDCGGGMDVSRKILGGEVAEINEFPWMALIEYQKPNGKTTACGGVLINSRYVLTAAHCVKGKDLPVTWRLTAVRLGEYNTTSERDCIELDQGAMFCADDPVTVGVEEQIAHESYIPRSRDQRNDIALLRLTRDVEFTSYIQPICLPSSSSMPQTKLFVAGWGKTETRSASDIKLKLEIPIADRSVCGNTYNQAGVTLGNGQICAGGEEGRDSCRGDSGGPLMAVETNDKWAAIGVVSFGPSPCGLLGWPGVYTKVSDYVPWIISKIRA